MVLCLTMFHLCFLYEFFFAFGTGNGDFSFPPRDTDLLTATRAVIVAMFTVFHSLDPLEKFSVLQISLIGFPGHHPVNCPYHNTVADDHQNKLYNCSRKNNRKQAEQQTHSQECHIQFICAVPSHHKLPVPLLYAIPHMIEKLHIITLYLFISYIIILHFFRISTGDTDCLRIIYTRHIISIFHIDCPGRDSL